MHIERIYQDSDLWNDKMLPKLKAFYDKVILPELACPRDGKSPGIREPGIWYVPPHHRHKPKKRKKTSTAAKSSQSSSSSTRYTETTEHSPSTIPQLRSKNRNRQTKFLGRTIAHEWIVDEHSQKKDWFKGTVLSLISGTDGDLHAVYEVFYEGEDECYEIDHLIEDYQSGSVQFCDV